jgi:hypothetical protein
LTGRTGESGEPDCLAAERKADDLQLREQHVEVGELGFARAGQVARRNVDDLIGVTEIRGTHVLRIGTSA